MFGNIRVPNRLLHTVASCSKYTRSFTVRCIRSSTILLIKLFISVAFPSLRDFNIFELNSCH
ncbi:ORF214 [White spot syndrome virus]|uniref:ORF214 n=1 Tax=White spot syndrome virus TaxID=342409 RepID=A0A2D3I705_9VIRU|nr:ORF214 [White spot syndrome virus]